MYFIFGLRKCDLFLLGKKYQTDDNKITNKVASAQKIKEDTVKTHNNNFRSSKNSKYYK